MLNNPHYSCLVIKFLNFCHLQNLYFWTTKSTICLKGREDLHVIYASCDFKLCCLCRRKKPRTSSSTLSNEKSIVQGEKCQYFNTQEKKLFLYHV